MLNKVKLGELFTRFSSGKCITEEHIYENGEFPVFGGNGKRGYTNNKNFSGECIIIGRQGAKCGNVRYYSGEAYMTDHAIVGVPTATNSALYLTYALKALNLNRLSGQAAQPGLSVSMLKKQNVLVQDWETQIKISNVISKYDELIELNNKRIKLFEQTAEELYKEWFVRFRFPNYQNTEFENGIPKGWVKGKIKDFVEFENGFAFKSEDYLNEGKYGIVTIKNVQDGKFDDNKIEYIDDIPKRMPLYCKLNTGDILMSLTGNVGRLCFVSGNNYLLNQRLCKVISNYPYFTYNFFRQDTIYQTLCNIAYGTAQLNLSPVLARNLKVIIPSEKLMKLYNDTVSPNYEIMQKLRIQNNNLIKQRDLLLPRLMSGKLEVK